MNSPPSHNLRQSYRNAWNNCKESITNPNAIRWDYIVLTASNEDQAHAYTIQLANRRDEEILPDHTQFIVLPDPGGARIGSGGATFHVLRHIAALRPRSSENPFSGRRILVIHSGGDSKRIPQYSACGKLFSPIPRELPTGRGSMLFDELMISSSSIPSRMTEGMLVLSGDVLLLFDPGQIDFSGEAATAISCKAHVETGRNHGVYLVDEKGRVGDFLHKQSVDLLRERGAVDDGDRVNIDTGAVYLSADVLKSLYGLISTRNRHDESKLQAFANDHVRLSFYGDFLYPLASRATLPQYYKEKPEKEYSRELRDCRTAIWNALRGYRMKLVRLSPAAFIHLGTTRELLRLMTEHMADYAFLGWTNNASSNVENPRYTVHNSVVDDASQIADAAYIENSHVCGGAKVGAGSILSSVTVSDSEIPDHVVLHGLKQKDGRFVARIYGIDDDPKGMLEDDTPFLGIPLSHFMRINRISPDELWPTHEHHLWFADLYPESDTIEEAVQAALNVYEMSRGRGDVGAWRKASRKSLYAGFREADAQAILDWEMIIRKRVRVEKLLKLIRCGGTDEQAREVFSVSALDDAQKRMLESRAESTDLSTKMRIYHYMSRIVDAPEEREHYRAKCFGAIRDGILMGARANLCADEGYRIAKDEVDIRLPLRVNWGGGWSDTPPYCNEKGGTVLNAAISLGGRLPVEVRLKRLSDKKIVLASEDRGLYREFAQIGELQNFSDPLDPFGMHKAALIACNVLPMERGELESILTRLGGGIYLSTQVRGVPMGSGLGTSSILAGACVKGLFEFMGKSHAHADLYERALCMEQIMSTGGGWQDQVGGLTNGMKYITSRPGSRQEIVVTPVRIPAESLNELNERFALIYTGQRRLARHLLRDIMGRYIGANPEVLHALSEIQRLATRMRFELERGNIDEFAALLSAHWELSKRLDSGSTNAHIDQIFASVEHLTAGRMICGAGGGGFLQVILKKNVTQSQLRQRLREGFVDRGVDVWDCGLV